MCSTSHGDERGSRPPPRRVAGQTAGRERDVDGVAPAGARARARRVAPPSLERGNDRGLRARLPRAPALARVLAEMMPWWISWRADPRGRRLADAHYNRQSVGHPNFVPPGRCLVLVTEGADALWVSSWPLAEYVRHAWAGAWINSTFRRDPTAPLASDLIRRAVAATRSIWGDPPPLGMVTFVDPAAVKRKRDPGRCYRHAGFQLVGRTKINGHLAWQLLPADMPDPEYPLGATPRLL